MNITIFCSWLGYYAVHSLLASNQIKTAISRQLPGLTKYYRILFNLVATLGLIMLTYQWYCSEQIRLFEPQGSISLASGILLGLGAYIAITAFRNYDLMEFAGLRTEKAGTQSRLNTSGWNSIVRHPLYLGTVLFLSGFFAAYPTQTVLSIVLATFCYLPVGIWLEEKKLGEAFGTEYQLYQKKVKALIPGIW